MDIVLSYDNMAEVLVLPVLPEAFQMPFNPRENEEFEVINGIDGVGKLNLIGLRGLKTLTLESFFPIKRYPFVKTDVIGWECVNLINKWANSRSPIRIIVTSSDGLEILNMSCTIENFTYGVDRAEDIPYSLELKEFLIPVVE